jgi:RecA/RadA recombinase
MVKGRVSQHKPERDSVSAVKENRELKQENRSLRKQLSKLRKQLAQMTESHFLIQQITDDEAVMVSKEPADGNCCVSCGKNNLSVLAIPGSSTILNICKACGHKERKKQ